MPSARHVNWAKFRVTSVAIVSLLILGELAYLLTGGLLMQRKVTLYLFLPDATGLSAGSPVRVDGIPVGKVSRVELSGSREPDRVVKVTLTVEEGHLRDIPADSTAQTSADTLLGDQFVDVSSGRDPVRIRPNSEIRFRGDTELLKIDLAQFEHQLRIVDAVLRDIEAGRGRVGEFIAGDEMYENLRGKLAELQSGIQAARSTTSDLGRALYTEQSYSSIRNSVARLDQSLARLQAGQGPGGRLLRDDAQYRQFLNSASQLRRTVADVRAGRGAGGDLVMSDRSWVEWNRRLSSVIDSVDRMNAGPAFATSAAYDNLNEMTKELRDTLRDLREHPNKYMRLKVF